MKRGSTDAVRQCVTCVTYTCNPLVKIFLKVATALGSMSVQAAKTAQKFGGVLAPAIYNSRQIGRTCDALKIKLSQPPAALREFYDFGAKLADGGLRHVVTANPLDGVSQATLCGNQSASGVGKSGRVVVQWVELAMMRMRHAAREKQKKDS